LKSIPHAAGRVHFTGYLTGEPLADAYSAMNLFGFSSRTETFGNVLLEAMASGLPVVAIADGGPADVVQDQVTGRLIAPDAPPEEMSQTLVEWITDKTVRQNIAMNARNYAETVTWEQIMNGLLKNYQEALKSFHSENPKSSS
jgi:glycosyltransferase involved in cell wall biosynthesis